MSDNNKELFDELDKMIGELSESDGDPSDILDNIITMTDEDGRDARFEFLDLIEYEGEEYVILLPADEDEYSPGEVIILKVEESGEEEESYVSVDDDDILNAVFGIFKEKFVDEFDFVD